MALRQLSKQERDMILRVAYRRFVLGENQVEIAASLGIHQFEVSRYLKRAEAHKLVKTVLVEEPLEEIRQQFKSVFKDLKDVVIAPSVEGDERHSSQFLASTAAQYFAESVNDEAEIGLSCGGTLNTVIEALGNLPERFPLPVLCKVYPLIIQLGPEIEGITPSALVSGLTRRLPRSRGEAFQLPSDLPGKLKSKSSVVDFYMNTPAVHRLLTLINKLNWYFIGIGYIDSERENKPHGWSRMEFNAIVERLGLFDALRKLGAVGETGYQPFDAEGRSLIDSPLLSPLRNSMLYMPNTMLRNRVEKGARVVAVASGVRKLPGIRAALKSRLCNILITDSSTAKAILQSESQLLEKRSAI